MHNIGANGNLTARASDTFAYDQANRLKSASVSGTSSTYSYDGDGKRASKTVGGTQTNYTYDVNASLPVLLDDGTHKYVWGLGLAFAVDTSGNPLVYHTDGLGSVRALTDASGSVVQTYQYDEYGNVMASSGSITQPFQYTGEQVDETGLIYLRARYYDPASGRFLSTDNYAGDCSKPESLNRFDYVNNEPTVLSDPDGHCPLCLAAVAVEVLEGGVTAATLAAGVYVYKDRIAQGVDSLGTLLASAKDREGSYDPLEELGKGKGLDQIAKEHNAWREKLGTSIGTPPILPPQLPEEPQWRKDWKTKVAVFAVLVATVKSVGDQMLGNVPSTPPKEPNSKM